MKNIFSADVFLEEAAYLIVYWKATFQMNFY